MSEDADHTFSSGMRQLALFLAFFTLAAFAQAAAPSVLLFIVIDQFLPEYLDSRDYTGGLKKLHDESAWFTNAHHRHVPTETAPGHAALMTGLPPGKTGIIGNDWYDRKSGKRIFSTEPGALLAATVGDRLKEKNPRSKVISLSGKERSARMMGGRSADVLRWYPLRSDRTVVQAAISVMVENEIGQDDNPDLVAISLSKTDVTGHQYGPDSAEMKENLVELDGALGELFVFCEKKFGPDGFVAIVTSDHGVLSKPERLDRKKLFRDIEAALEKAFPGKENLLTFMSLPDLYLNRNKVTSTVRALEAVKTVPGIAHAYLPPFDEKDKFIDAYRASYYPGRSGDLLIRLDEGTIATSRKTGTSHGSPYEYDTHVPILLWGKMFKQGHYKKQVSTLDVAPTAALILGLSSEGKPLIEALSK